MIITESKHTFVIDPIVAMFYINNERNMIQLLPPKRTTSTFPVSTDFLLDQYIVRCSSF